MPISKNFLITIVDIEKIPDVNKIIFKYSVSSSQSSLQEHYKIPYLNLNDIYPDITFFKMVCENETELDNQMNDLIEELNKTGTYYSLKDEDTGELLVLINSVGEMNIKFDKIKIIPEGTYEKIDELKSSKTEFGSCRSYKPEFRPLEGKPIENIDIIPEPIYMFCDSQEDLLKLKDYLSERIMEINPDFELEFKILE